MWNNYNPCCCCCCFYTQNGLVCSSNRDAGGYCFCTIKWFASSKLATPWTVQQMWLYSAKLMHFLSCETNAKSFGKRKQMPASSDSPKPWRAAVKDWSTWAKAQKTHSLKFKLAMGHCCEIQACDSFLLIGTKVETANLATFQLQLLSGFIPDPHRVVLPDHHSGCWHNSPSCKQAIMQMPWHKQAGFPVRLSKSQFSRNNTIYRRPSLNRLAFQRDRQMAKNKYILL